jgi:hypothetical protein
VATSSDDFKAFKTAFHTNRVRQLGPGVGPFGLAADIDTATIDAAVGALGGGGRRRSKPVVGGTVLAKFGDEWVRASVVSVEHNKYGDDREGGTLYEVLLPLGFVWKASAGEIKALPPFLPTVVPVRLDPPVGSAMMPTVGSTIFYQLNGRFEEMVVLGVVLGMECVEQQVCGHSNESISSGPTSGWYHVCLIRYGMRRVQIQIAAVDKDVTWSFRRDCRLDVHQIRLRQQQRRRQRQQLQLQQEEEQRQQHAAERRQQQNRWAKEERRAATFWKTRLNWKAVELDNQHAVSVGNVAVTAEAGTCAGLQDNRRPKLGLPVLAMWHDEWYLANCGH